MELYNKITLSQARKDLKYLHDVYGNLEDFCGSFCNTDMLTHILMGKISIKEAIIENIVSYFSNGLERRWIHGLSNKFPDKDDKRVQKIINRYYIES